MGSSSIINIVCHLILINIFNPLIPSFKSLSQRANLQEPARGHADPHQ